MKVAMIILWPAFLAAGVAEVLFFTVFDPSEFGAGRMAAYSAGFLIFWLLAAASSTLTCFLQRGAEEINKGRSG
ncbi:MAG: hypothetical protein JO292_13280 [Betaproteobacteria bacterium]|nr:hypothetical protein [Betaproteobacteria bacterium]MBV9362356.1 hypothetical protein [Betaproteobacteria bacterium]